MAIALYARKSVERENSVSCETQLEYCRSMLKPDERSEKVIEIVDNGFSGGNTDRDGFQKMMLLVRKGKISKVIVYKLDRISRSLMDFVSILNEFKEHRVKFVSSQETIDTSSPQGDMLVKLLMIFAEFERTTTIARVAQAYAYRSDMGFYMGGRRPYGFELVPTVMHGIQTKMLHPISSEAEQVKYIYEVYAQENVSLRRLRDILITEDKLPSEGCWTTAKLSTILRNPIYVKADSAVYEYFTQHGAKIVGQLSDFIGQYGAQLYGRTKHDPDNPDWSDMKLVLLSHEGLVSSDFWMKCQRKLEKNRQIGNSLSNQTSWLAGKVRCEICGHTMTTIKGKANQEGIIRRYFNCTGKTHKKICTGPKVSIYAKDLEDMVYTCIAEKLSGLNGIKRTAESNASGEVNDLKLKILAIEKEEQLLVNTMLSGGFNEALLTLANQKADRLKQDRLALYERMEEWKNKGEEQKSVIHLTRSWKSADYDRKKAVAALMLDKILISENGDVQLIWNM